MIPESFAKHAARVWGEAGQAWVEQLPTAIARHASKWNVSVSAFVPDPSYSIVAFGTRKGRPVVLKFGFPDRDFHSQVRALRAFRGDGCVRLIDADTREGAMLLQRVEPGVPLWARWTPEVDDQHSQLLAEAMLHLAKPAAAGFPTVEQWCRAFVQYRHRYPERGPLPEAMLHTAESLLRDLLDPRPSNLVLLHGDLHHGNLLSGEPDHLAIDPKGVVGEAAFEAYAMIRNPCDRFVPNRRLLQRRLRIVADITRLDLHRLRGWCVVGCVLSACWSLEAREDGWQHALACAKLVIEEA